MLILTRNEQQDLPGCLASVAWSDDVHVLDSLSTDRTREIAREAGAQVTERAFDGYASQRNAGLRLPFRHPWLLVLDADERVPPALAREIEAFVQGAGTHVDVAAARMRRRDIWWGTWLRRSQISPFYVRLLRPERARYEREINEVLVVDGPIADLAQPFDHYPFSKGLDHWLDKHNTYSRMEAQLILSRSVPQPSWRTALFGADFNERRVHQKAIFYRLPARPLIKLAYMLVWRRGVLDGVAGIRYALLQTIYEYLIVLKVKEAEQGQRASAASERP
ncbi:glycosyltransferase family 2 protein [Hydrogenophaga sp. ANAO-22]|uniref:glycosyltransferase family 2 protein n=1 Tax=Hydrogenophaga sp. ANAO-22 TaxID=3166645 RepID=UPI0036D3F13D